MMFLLKRPQQRYPALPDDAIFHPARDRRGLRQSTFRRKHIKTTRIKRPGKIKAQGKLPFMGLQIGKAKV